MPSKRCDPQKFILYLEIHKTCSATLANVVIRYADKQTLTVLLPKDHRKSEFGHPKKFRGINADTICQQWQLCQICIVITEI